MPDRLPQVYLIGCHVWQALLDCIWQASACVKLMRLGEAWPQSAGARKHSPGSCTGFALHRRQELIEPNPNLNLNALHTRHGRESQIPKACTKVRSPCWASLEIVLLSLQHLLAVAIYLRASNTFHFQAAFVYNCGR